MCKKADLIIVDCSLPATGLGWELGAAVEAFHKEVLVVARKDAKVSRLVRGARCERNPNFSFRTYESTEELLFLCQEKIKQMHVQHQHA